MNDPRDTAEVYQVRNPIRGLPHVQAGDHITLIEDGRVFLQREVDAETFTTLGTAEALIKLKLKELTDDDRH